MYSAGYGYANNAPPSFNNNAPQQPGAQSTGQQVMYNQQQQFAGMAPQGAYASGANPQMMTGGPTGMMPNPGMPHMAPNGQMPNYQQQFTAAPYGQVVPSTVAPQGFTPQYMMAGGMQGFAMNQAGMPQQPQIMQRMAQQSQQPQQQPPNPAAMGQVGTPQRPPSAAQATPNNSVPPPPGQFSTPQPPSQSQTPTNQQPQSAGVSTPQTPTFSVNQGVAVNGSSGGIPLSPGSESRDKERFSLLLDINHELLYESIQIQATQQELKKGHTPDAKPSEEETLFQQDYLQCMRRLQANLSYMAALADRKPEVKAPPCPAYLSAPPLNLSLRLRTSVAAPEGPDKLDPVADREERDKSIKELYSRLQAVFPGFDPKKEPVYRVPPGGPQGHKHNPGMTQASPTTQKTPQMTNMPAPPTQQPMQYQPILQQ